MILDDISKIGGIKIEVINENVVRKTFSYDISNTYDQKWLNAYNKLREWDPRYIEVYGVGSNYIDMKYIKDAMTISELISGRLQMSKNNLQYNLNKRISLIYEYIEIIFKVQQSLSIHSGNFLIHTDINPGNVLISNGQLIIIDPDSCVFNPNLNKLFGDTVCELTKIFNRYYVFLNKKI